jgi:hypothetical protein
MGGALNLGIRILAILLQGLLFCSAGGIVQDTGLDLGAISAI